MTEVEWREERESLLESLRENKQIAVESQAEVAVYRQMLEECWQAASEALKEENLNLLYEITGKLSFDWMPSKREGKQWGKLFLHACMRDARWLERTKKRLEEIETYAEQLLEDNETNAELKKKIIAAAQDGLVTHI